MVMGAFGALAARGLSLLPRIPGIGGTLSRAAGTPAAGQALRQLGGAARSVTGLGLPGIAGTAARSFGAFSLGTAALGAGTRLLGGGGGRRDVTTAQDLGAAVMPGLEGGGGDMLTAILAAQGGMITKVWQPTPQSPIFAKLDFPGSNRRSKIIYQRIDGTIGSYTPQRMIVLSRNPRVKDLKRAATRIDALTKSVVKAPVQTRRAKKRMTG